MLAAGRSRTPLRNEILSARRRDVHSLVEDVIDQQRHVNRMITIMDRMMATAAKGVLLFPSKCKPDELDWPTSCSCGPTPEV